MIPYQELRIGNYVLVDKKKQQVAMVDQRSSKAAMFSTDETATNAEFTLDVLMPIALTDDVLVQCGFAYHDYFKFWQLIEGVEANRSEMDIDSDYNIIDFMRKPVVKRMTSLHQLQNVYYMLKGKELNINRKTSALLSQVS